MVTENGAVLPNGTPTFVVGTTAPGTTSLRSGRALAASRGAAELEDNRGRMFASAGEALKGASNLNIQKGRRHTQGRLVVSWHLQPKDAVRRAVLQKAVPNPETVCVANGLELYEDLEKG